MNKVLKISLLSVVLILAGNFAASAQIKPSAKKPTDAPKTEQPDNSNDAKPTTTRSTSKKKTEEYFDESGGFKHRLWYGGSFNLGFSGSGNNSLFQIGVTPMVGYKIIGGLSAGPRIGINYTSYKGPDSRNLSNSASVSLVDYSVGAFTRYKFGQNFFIQGEYEYSSHEYPYDGARYYGYGLPVYFNADGSTTRTRVNQSNYYGGVGYNSGGLWGYEIMLLYNLAVNTNDPNSIEQPWDYRFGFTWKF